MGSHYRARHERPASTTTAELAGLGTPQAEAYVSVDDSQRPPDLDEMTKAELLEHGKQLGLDVKQAQAKDEIRAIIDNA